MRTPTLPTQLLWTAATVLLGIASAGANSDRPDAGPFGVGPLGAAILGVVAAGTAQLALTRPRLALVLCGLATGLFHAVGYDDGPIPLALPAAGFVAALSLRPRRQWPALAVASALVTAGLLTLAGSADSWMGTLWRASGAVLLAVAASAAGWWWSAREEARRERTTRVATEEQLRMARDLHDGVGHGLAVIAMQAGVALHVLDRDPDAARRALLAIRESSTESLGALRNELAGLTGADAGEAAARRPGRGLADIGPLIDRVRATGLAVTADITTTALPPAVGEAAYGIIQEALTNVLKHADATQADVVLTERDGALHVRVSDNGRSPGAATTAGLGISGMRSRAGALGGDLYAGPRPDGGYEVLATLPVTAEVAP